MEKRNATLEDTVNHLKHRIEEVSLELETSQRDLRAAQGEVNRLKQAIEKLTEQRDALVRDKKKLEGTV